MRPVKLFVPFSAVLVSLWAVAAHAETLNCTVIASLPAVITQQGNYCLAGHLSTGITSSSAIEIQANNVILDLNGYKVGGIAAGPGTTAVGIHAADRQNITIKNGTVRGFLRGIFLQDSGASQGHVVEDIRADLNTYVGIEVNGSGNIVRNNQVVTTGGSTVLGPNAGALGISVAGAGPRVINNDVLTVSKQGIGVAHGIYFSGVVGGLALGNRITSVDVAIEYAASSGKYRDNLTFAVTTPFAGGSDAGNNN
jgi:hypothetical protein